MDNLYGMGPDNDKLTRYLSPLGAWALAFGCAVGWGAFIMPGTIFLPTAGPLGTALGMALGTAVMLVIGFNFYYLMNRYRDPGGAFTYVREVFGYDHGFLCAWFLILPYLGIMWANAMAFVLVARNLVGGILQVGFHYQVAGYDIYGGELAVSSGVILLAGLICLFSKRLTSLLQTFMALFLLGGVFVALGSAFVSTGHGFALPAFASGESRLVQAIQITVLTPWAFVGFESVSHSAGEFRFSPRKSFCVIAAAVISTGLAYVALTWLATSELPEGFSSWTDYVANLGHQEGLKALPVFYAVEVLLGRSGLCLLAATLIAAVGTGLVGNMLAASRLIYAMAGAGILPKKLHVLGRYNTPWLAILLITIPSVFVPLLGRTAIVWIVDVNTVGATIPYGYVSAAALWIAHRESRRPVQLMGALGILISAAFFLLGLFPNHMSVSTLSTESYLILTVWGLLGLAFFRVAVGRNQDQRLGKSVVVWVAMLLLLFSASAVWMSQDMKQMALSLAGSSAAYEAYEKLSTLLTRDYLIQTGLIALSLAIVFSIFSLMTRRERALEVKRARAEKANAAKSEFLANMSHEIRTPINAVLGMNEMIIRESKDKRVTVYARNVESAGKNLLSIINDILDFSKIEAGKMEIVEAGYRLSSVLNDVTNMIVFKARQKDLQFNIDVDRTLPDELYGDEVRVRQVVTNVLNNAVKYTREGSVSFQVSGERKGDAMNLTFRVKDTGIGIRKEDISRLFKKFQRVDLAQNSTVEGTGLGLSITQNLLKLMQGDIQVESEYGKGSTFTIHIPQKIVNDSPIGDFKENFERYIHGMRAYRESFRAPGARILVVDDTEMNLTVVEGLLGKTEIQIDTASGGAEALKLTKGTPYDLILMDQRMPLMDGTEALRRIREQAGGINHQTPVICLTADAVSGARAKYLEDGFTDYLSKPVEGAAIEAALIKYLPASKVILQKISGYDGDGNPEDGPELEEQDAGGQSQETGLKAFYGETEGLNYADAVRFCSNDEILQKTLEQFYRSIASNADSIEGFLREKDYKNYTIKVHALKSSARLIGAQALSDEARYLEDCGNELSKIALQEIESRTPKLLADYRGYLEKLSPLYAAEEAARNSAPEISPDELHEAYEAIREFAGSFDIDSIDGVIAELRKYRVPQEEADRFRAIEECVRNTDWNGLEAALNGAAMAGKGE